MTKKPESVRWIFASLNGLGDVVFETADPISDVPVRAWRCCHVRVLKDEKGNIIEKNVRKLPGYALGLHADPLVFNPWAFNMACVAPKDLGEAATKEWTPKPVVQIHRRLPPENKQ